MSLSLTIDGERWRSHLLRTVRTHPGIVPVYGYGRLPDGRPFFTMKEIRGLVDINWASDIDATIPITMRNQDIERLRDGMGAMDYRVQDIESVAGGQRFEGSFAPPAQLARDMGVNSVKLERQPRVLTRALQDAIPQALAQDGHELE